MRACSRTQCFSVVRLADSLDYEHGGRRVAEFAERLGRTEAAVRQRASKLRARWPIEGGS